MGYNGNLVKNLIMDDVKLLKAIGLRAKNNVAYRPAYWSIVTRLNDAGWDNLAPGFFHDDDGYTMSLQLPGIKKESLDISVDPASRTLDVRVMAAEVVSDGETEDVVDVVKDRYTAHIPNEADISQDPKAKLELGILSVTFPENEATKPRTIEVTVE